MHFHPKHEYFWHQYGRINGQSRASTTVSYGVFQNFFWAIFGSRQRKSRPMWFS
jgi:hypothetical protein